MTTANSASNTRRRSMLYVMVIAMVILASFITSSAAKELSSEIRLDGDLTVEADELLVHSTDKTKVAPLERPRVGANSTMPRPPPPFWAVSDRGFLSYRASTGSKRKGGKSTIMSHFFDSLLRGSSSVEEVCSDSATKALCQVMRGNEPATTDKIADSLRPLFETFVPSTDKASLNYPKDVPHVMKRMSSLFFDLNNIPSSAAEKENIFDWLSMASCRVGYNQNPTGEHKPNSPILIPKELAVPLLEFARKLGREPSVSYSTMVLDNCVDHSFDDKAMPEYEDWSILRTVTSSNSTNPSEQIAHRAEKGFYASHCAVEKAFGESILVLQSLIDEDKAAIQARMNATDDASMKKIEPDADAYKRKLRRIAYNVRIAATSLHHMRHFYDSSHFFHYLRPYLKCGNIAENGIIFDLGNDVDGKPKSYDIRLNNGTIRHVVSGEVIYGIRGPSGAGTTSLSSIDAGLQITTSIQANPDLELTMNEFRQFHPKEHYQFNDALRELHLREKIIAWNDREVIDAYNDAIVAVAQFRNAHIEHVGTYILKSVKHIHPKYITGTGNTPIVKYLCDSFFGTFQSMITGKELDVSSNLPEISIDSLCFAECLSGKYDIHNERYCASAMATLNALN